MAKTQQPPKPIPTIPTPGTKSIPNPRPTPITRPLPKN